MDCQGECNKQYRCFGDVKTVSVSGNGFYKPFTFNYCQEAIEEDEKRGFIVKVISSCDKACSPSDFREGGKCDEKGCFKKP